MPTTVKPTTIYIDQNVLDSLTKGKLQSVRNRLLREDIQVVYSSCNLEEIHRTTKEGLRKEFLDCLNSLDAVYFWTDDEDQAHATKQTVYESYSDHIKNEQTFGNPEEIVQNVLFKMFGGFESESFREVFDSSEVGFEGLLKVIMNQVDETGLSGSERELVASHVETLREQFKNASNEFLETLETDHGTGVGYSMIEDTRAFTGVGPQQLNNIEPPRVIQQIWDVLSSSENFPSETVTFDSFFGENGALARALPQPTKVNKINGLYGLLNTIGYHSDPKLARHGKFRASLGDHQHAGYASYADEVLSRDLKFVKKAEAVYEHLDIPTVVTFVETKKEAT